jgi:SAM-dependent methyltransferase
MGDRKFDNFDEFGTQYRVSHTDNIKRISGVDSDYFSEYKVKEIMTCENNVQNGAVLDFGCGDGNSAPFFQKHLKPRTYYGIDISANCIDIANKSNLERCYFQIFDGEMIPFEDNAFDIVFIANVLHHIDRARHLHIIQECHRILKNTGRLYIFEHNPHNPLTRKLVRDCPFDVCAELLPASNIMHIIKKAGFRDIKKRYTIFFPRKFPFQHLVFFERYLRWCPFGGQYYVKCVK